MDVKAFHTANKKFLQGRPFSDPEKFNQCWTMLEKAAAPEHVGKPAGEHMTDRVECSCGWKSRGFWDGMEYAWGDWRQHVVDEMGLIPKTCPCGKTYLPADGEMPCHELRSTQHKKNG